MSQSVLLDLLDFVVLWALLVDWMLALCILCFWSFVLVLCRLLLLPLSASLEAKAVSFLSNLGQVVVIFIGFVLFLLNYNVSSQMLSCSGLTISGNIISSCSWSDSTAWGGEGIHTVGAVSPLPSPQMVLVADGHSAEVGALDWHRWHMAQFILNNIHWCWHGWHYHRPGFKGRPPGRNTSAMCFLLPISFLWDIDWVKINPFNHVTMNHSCMKLGTILIFSFWEIKKVQIIR